MDTRKPLVSGASKDIVFDRELSNKIYESKKKDFTITKGGKTYRVKRVGGTTTS